MSKFILHNLTFAYSDYYSPLFDNVNLEIDASWKLGLIGRNARGKTTLLKLLHGILKPTGGQIVNEIDFANIGSKAAPNAEVELSPIR